MTRIHLPLSSMPFLVLGNHAELRLRHRGISEDLLREVLQQNLPALDEAACQLRGAEEKILVRCAPLAIVLCRDHTVATLLWSVPGVHGDFHHLPTGAESHPALGVQTAYLEASTEAGIDTRDILGALRDHRRTWIAIATLAHNNGRPLRATLGPYSLTLSRLHGYPNLVTPVRRTGA